MSNDDLIRRGDLLKPDEKSDKVLILGGRTGAGKTLAIAEALMKRKIETVPAVAAVPVEKLGKLGKYMMPYTGDPRGHMEWSGIGDVRREALLMDTFEDVDGSVWRPVLEPVLQELLRRVDAVPVVHGRWEWDTEDVYMCSNCCRKSHVKEVMGQPDWDFCPVCGAKMDGGEEDG